MDQEGDTPLHLAVLCDSPQCVKLLLNHGANTDAREFWALVSTLVDAVCVLPIKEMEMDKHRWTSRRREAMMTAWSW